MGYRTKKLEHLEIVARICERIQLVEQIDSFFPEKDRKVSVGLVVKAMLLNALGFSSPLFTSPPSSLRTNLWKLFWAKDLKPPISD